MGHLQRPEALPLSRTSEFCHMSDSSDSNAPKIQIDSDWKAQAQAEKQRLAEQSKTKSESSPTTGKTGGGAASPGELPPANFETLLSMLATQALLYMGGFPDPRTGQPILHLDIAKHHIDLLAVLESKTQNNLSAEEQDLLSTTLYELRGRFVQIATAARNAGLER